MLFESKQPNVQVPDDLTTWQWLFESKESSPIHSRSDEPLAAFIDAENGERLDWEEVHSKSTALSSCLIRDYDLKPDDTVLILSNNTIWYPVCMFAAVRAGGRVSGASAAYTIHEMAHALRVSEAKVVFTVPSAVDRALAAAEQVGIPRNNILLTHGEVVGFMNIQELIRLGSVVMPSPAYQIPAGSTSKEICGYLNFSSGTTGLPKAVMLSHYNIIAQCYLMRQLQIDPDRVKILAIMPLFHVTGTWRFIHYPIFLNGDAVMLPSFTMPAMLKAVVNYQIEELILVPPILLRLARDPVVDEYDLRHVRRWTSGAAPISLEVLKSLERRFPWTGFRQGYGATEAPCIAAQPPTHYDWKYGISVGMLLANTIGKVIDPDGEVLDPGQAGEILIKGPQIAMGYLNDEKATSDSFDSEGFYHTGDAGYFDQEGLIYVTDRIKEMIKVKGSQVPPAEIEDLLLSHPLVADCAVIGIPDDYAGELPKAYIVLKDQAKPIEELGFVLLDHVRDNKVRYKWLAEVEFIHKIPKSPAGKILRRVLREKEGQWGTNIAPRLRVKEIDRSKR